MKTAVSVFLFFQGRILFSNKIQFVPDRPEWNICGERKGGTGCPTGDY
jgi:hypothetical protein